jgi:hypothetical protein
MKGWPDRQRGERDEERSKTESHENTSWGWDKLRIDRGTTTLVVSTDGEGERGKNEFDRTVGMR